MSSPNTQSGHPPRLGPYEVTAELGRGGMGVVYRARHTELGVERALKVLERLEAKALARFEREAAHLARIQHVNVVQIHDLGVEAGRPWFAMTLAEGRPLNEVLEERRLPLANALALAHGIANGVGALHAAGVIHRDLKPANIVVGPDLRPIVLDLGLAVAPTLDQRLTRSGTTLGTVSYMAPEQFHGAEKSSPATDVYALGLILFELTTGRPAVERGSTQEIAAAILTEDRPRPTQVDPDLPAALDPLCRRATHRDPAHRPPDAAAFAAELSALTADPGPSRRSVRRRRRLAAALGIALLGGVAWAARPASTAPNAPGETARPDVAAVATETVTSPPTRRAEPRTPGQPWRKLRHRTCRGAAFLSDTQLVTWGEDRLIRLWDLETERVLQRWTAPTMIVAGAVTPDGKIAFADLRGVYVTKPGQREPRTLYSYASRFFPRALAFSPGGTQLVLGGKLEASALILEVSRGRLLRKVGQHGAKIDQIAFTRDGSRMATACGESMDEQRNRARDHAVRVFDAASGELLQRFPFVGQANAVAFHPSGDRFAVCADGQAVVVVELATGKRVQLEGRGAGKGSLLIAAHAGVSREVTYTPDGRYLLSASDGPLTQQNELRVWNGRTGAELAVLRGLAIVEASIGSLVVSPSGQDVALSHSKGAWVFDVEGLISPRTSPPGKR